MFSYFLLTTKNSKSTFELSREFIFHIELNRCIMVAIHDGHRAHKPCPVCLVDLDDLSKFMETHTSRTVDESQALVKLASTETSREKKDQILKSSGLCEVTV